MSSQLITVTKNAVKRIKKLVDEGTHGGPHLRVSIEGAGCSGFKYVFYFEEFFDKDDTHIDDDEISIIIDPISAQYIAGAELDFVEDVGASEFVFINPNAKSMCGCKQSFSI